MLCCIIREQFSLCKAQNVLMGLKHMPLFLFSPLSSTAQNEAMGNIFVPCAFLGNICENEMDDSRVVHVKVIF